MTTEQAVQLRVNCARAVESGIAEQDPVLYTVLGCCIAALDRFIDRPAPARQAKAKSAS